VTKNKKIYGNPIIIKNYTPCDSMSDLSALYLSHENIELFESLNEMAKSTSTVLICETQGQSEKGSAVNFVWVDSQLGFEINVQSFETTNMSISNYLQSLAININ